MKTKAELSDALLVWAQDVIDYYEGFKPNDLTQIHVKGPFAGLSERELLITAHRYIENETKYPR